MLTRHFRCCVFSPPKSKRKTGRAGKEDGMRTSRLITALCGTAILALGASARTDLNIGVILSLTGPGASLG